MKYRNLKRKPNKEECKIKFVKIICKNCGEENIIFTRASQKVKCPECNIIHNIPSSGKCKLINCKIKQNL